LNIDQPTAGIHYPRSSEEFGAWFRSSADCLDYLDWLRWPDGFTCPSCRCAGGWRLGDGRYECAGCGRRTSVTAGTIFDRTRTPLTVWFTAGWQFATEKEGITAQRLLRELDIGSYPTAWAMLHRLRSVLVRPGRDRLTGTVAVDQTFMFGHRPGPRGGRHQDVQVLTGIAVEMLTLKGVTRCRLAVLADASAESLNPFVAGAVEPGSTLITSAGRDYSDLGSLGYAHELRRRRYARPDHQPPDHQPPGELLPAVRSVAALARQWLLVTYPGPVNGAHLPAYLNEFAFRFNWRHARSPGLLFFRMLELATRHEPVRFHDLLASKKPRPVPPPVLDCPVAGRPWRKPAASPAASDTRSG
jgi:hypothetical protein